MNKSGGFFFNEGKSKGSPFQRIFRDVKIGEKTPFPRRDIYKQLQGISNYSNQTMLGTDPDISLPQNLVKEIRNLQAKEDKILLGLVR